MKIGDTVTFIGPSLFKHGANWTGTVIRMPLPWSNRKRRLKDTCVLVQRSGEVRNDGRPLLRPIHSRYLRLTAAK